MDDYKRLLNALHDQGWTVKQGKGHYKAIPPDPTRPLVIIGTTPSDHRAWNNVISLLRRSGLIWPPPK